MKISVIVKTNAKENKIEKIGEKEFKIFVKEPAKEGKANEAIIELLAEYFNVPRLKINIILGLKSKKKIILFDQADSV